MSAKCPFMSRSARRHFYMATAVLSLALWLLMLAAETSPRLHAWLHGGVIPDDDDCAVMALVHGKVESVDCVVILPVPAAAVEVAPSFEISNFSLSIVSLPQGRAPPLAS